MRRRRLGGLASIMVAALPLLAAPPPAAADTTIWWPAACAAGDITEFSVNLSDGDPDVNIAGWIQPCPETGSTNGFAIMYHAPNSNFITALQLYESVDAPTNFTWTVPYSQLSLVREVDGSDLRGLCLVRNYEHWLSCVSLEWDPDGTPHVAPVAPGDPGLQAPIHTTNPVGEGDRIIEPNCGTCV